VAHIRVDAQGFAWLPHDDFVAHFAPDVKPPEVDVMYAVQQPLTMSAFDDVMGPPAWKNHPTWFVVAQHDEVIPPDAERLFAQRMGASVVELDSSHVVMVSHPEEVADVIESAVRGATG
jgi:pimeloyl-ACP methyl ester carboxylesterase